MICVCVRAQFLTKLIGLNEFLPNIKFMSLVGGAMCSEGEITQPICVNVLFMFFGYDPEQLNQVRSAQRTAVSKTLLHLDRGQLRPLSFRLPCPTSSPIPRPARRRSRCCTSGSR